MGECTGDFDTLFPPASIGPWQVVSGAVDYQCDESLWDAGYGVRNVDVSGNQAGSIEQAFATQPDTIYEVQFLMVGNNYGGPTIKTMDVLAS